MIIIFKLENNFKSSDAIPIFKENQIGYSRGENNGYISLSTKDNYQYPILLNPSSLNLIEMINGQLSLKLIIDSWVEKYGDDKRKLIEKDVFDTIIKLWKIGLIDWKKGRIPYMDKFKFELGEDISVELAFDNSLNKILKFVNSTDLGTIEYVNPLTETDWKDNYVLRNALFTMNTIILKVYTKAELTGVLILSPQNLKVTSLVLEYMKITDLPILNKVVDNIDTIVKNIALSEYTKIYLYTRENNDKDKLLLTELINNFKKVCTLKKEINNLNIDLYEKLF